MPADTETLTAALRRLLRRGLPVDPIAATSELLDLPGVVARARGSADPAARARALDGVLRGQLARFAHASLAPAAQTLFGALSSATGQRLTARREEAARASGYEANHFRKHIEPRICALLAEQLLADTETFAAAHVTAPRLTIDEGTLRLPPDVFAWEVAEHEEALCELWSLLYALRATLLKAARLASMDGGTASAETVDEALWRYAALRTAIKRYRAAYGPVLLPAHTTPVAPAELEKLVGPVPQLPPTDLALLSTLPTADLQTFTAQLAETSDGAQIRTTWHRALTEQLTETVTRSTT